MILYISSVSENPFAFRDQQLPAHKSLPSRQRGNQKLELNGSLTIVPVHLAIDARLCVDTDDNKNHHNCNQNRTNYCNYRTSCIRVNEIRSYSIWRKQSRIICQKGRVDVRWKGRGHGCRMHRMMVMFNYSGCTVIQRPERDVSTATRTGGTRR